MGTIDYIRAALDACAVVFLALYALRRYAARTGHPRLLVSQKTLRPARYFMRLSAGYLLAGVLLYGLRYIISLTWMGPETAAYDPMRFGLEHAALSAWIWTLLFAGVALAMAHGAPRNAADDDDDDDDMEQE